MLRKSPFFDCLNHQNASAFDDCLASSTEDEHYIDWNGFVVPNDHGHPEREYQSIRGSCGCAMCLRCRKFVSKERMLGLFWTEC